MTGQNRFSDAPAGGNFLSRTCTISATSQVGDLLILEWTDAGTDFVNGETPPSGWTFLGETDASHASTMGIYLYSKICQAGDIGATITRTADATRRQGVAVVGYYDDAGASLSVESAVFSGSSLTTPSAVTVAPNCFAVAGAGVRGGGGDAFAPPAGWVERVDQGTDVASGGKNWTIADKLAAVSSGTNLGGAAFTNSDTTQACSWVVVVKPTPPAAAGDLGFFCL